MKRYLLKLSGEALIGKYDYGIDPDIVNEISSKAVVLCKENNIPLKVFNMLKKGSLMSIINGENTGTTIK